jgi:hypothetical protein
MTAQANTAVSDAVSCPLCGTQIVRAAEGFYVHKPMLNQPCILAGLVISASSVAAWNRRATADVTEAAERICRATGLDWESLDDTGPEDEVNGFGPETKGWFRYLARAALSSGDAS